MEVVCEHCNAKLNIPDEKLPRDQRVKVACPRCKNKLILDTSEAKSTVLSPAAEDVAQSGRVEEGGETAQPEEVSWPDEDEEDTALDSYEEGEQLVLVMDGDTHHTEVVKQALEELGYRYVSAENSREAISKLRFHHFDFVILADHFDNLPLEQSPILKYLNNLTMSIRRRVFVVLIGEKFKTMDHMMGFALSANLVMNVKDLDKMAGILRRSVSDNNKFYKVFFDTLEETGRA